MTKKTIILISIGFILIELIIGVFAGQKFIENYDGNNLGLNLMALSIIIGNVMLHTKHNQEEINPSLIFYLFPRLSEHYVKLDLLFRQKCVIH